MATPQNPYLKRFVAPGDPAGGAVPARAPTPALQRDNPLADDGYDSLRDFGGEIKSGAQALDRGMDRLTTQPKPVAWNMRPTRDRSGFPAVAYAATPGGEPRLQRMPQNFFRPQTGPESAAQVGRIRRPAVKWVNGPADGPPTLRPAAAATPALPAASRGAAAGGTPARSATPAAAAASPATIPATPAPVIQRPTSEHGKTLGYGAVVNDVPTFSDGTGGMAATMDKGAMDQLAQERSISRADVGAAGNVLASDVTGAPVSTADRVATLVRNAPVPITGSRPTAQQFADADRTAIAMRDPRSAAGIAARNLSIDAQYGSSPQRRMAEKALAQLSTGSNTGGVLAQQGEQDQANTADRGRNALDAIQLQGANQLADTALSARLRPPTPGELVQAEDGSYTVVDPRTAASTPVRGQDGKALKGMVTRDDSSTKRTHEVLDQLNKGVQEQMKAYLPTPDAPTPTPDMIAAWREQNARAMGLRLGTDPKTGRRVANINGQVVPL